MPFVLPVFLVSVAGLAPSPIPPHPSDTVGVPVVWRANGGSISALGLYTAGPLAGTYRIVAVAGGMTGTALITLSPAPDRIGTETPPSAETRPADRPPGRGIPFGVFGSRYGGALDPTDNFTLSIATQTPRNILSRLEAARGAHKQLILAMAGGAHRLYLTDGVFDMAKWMRKMDEYNTPVIRDAVASGVADGTIVGNSVMDEPNNTSPDNSWGPAGTMTKARVDSMCTYVKAIFPTLPVGVAHDYRAFDPEHTYSVCEFVVSQYRESKGPVTAYREGGLAFARRSGISIAFSINLLDGGTRVKGCPVPQTGGPGTLGSSCRMRPDQVREYGLALGPAGCAFTMWRYDSAFMADPENQRAFKDIAARLATLPARSCARPQTPAP